MVAVISSEGHGVNAWDTRSLASECLRQKDLADNGFAVALPASFTTATATADVRFANLVPFKSRHKLSIGPPAASGFKMQGNTTEDMPRDAAGEGVSLRLNQKIDDACANAPPRPFQRKPALDWRGLGLDRADRHRANFPARISRYEPEISYTTPLYNREADTCGSTGSLESLDTSLEIGVPCPELCYLLPEKAASGMQGMGHWGATAKQGLRRRQHGVIGVIGHISGDRRALPGVVLLAPREGGSTGSLESLDTSLEIGVPCPELCYLLPEKAASGMQGMGHWGAKAKQGLRRCEDQGRHGRRRKAEKGRQNDCDHPALDFSTVWTYAFTQRRQVFSHTPAHKRKLDAQNLTASLSTAATDGSGDAAELLQHALSAIAQDALFDGWRSTGASALGMRAREVGLRGCGLDKQLPLLPNKTSFRYRYVQGSHVQAVKNMLQHRCAREVATAEGESVDTMFGASLRNRIHPCDSFVRGPTGTTVGEQLHTFLQDKKRTGTTVGEQLHTFLQDKKRRRDRGSLMETGMDDVQAGMGKEYARTSYVHGDVADDGKQTLGAITKQT
ncbi:hypothetical protein AK812_SmicGene23650 [Symbiodinium microadriaticum]|uniref:Uncharacterized protein n=1 Tax=Symbiodinium microadriaticum TaxID=2951 RepID=A0A1Q9DGV1_SYMMI|nr:hypothetical protein AK812_SmicGene23650 [Symbiodinium microadriaticum]